MSRVEHLADAEAEQRGRLVGRAEAFEEAAKAAKDWLDVWAADLWATFESYIEAQTSGKHAGRRIDAATAKMFAGQFREQAEAVAGCSDGVAAAIRALAKPQEAGHE